MIKSKPGNPATLYAHACVLAELGRKSDALAELTKAVDNGFIDAEKAAGEAHFKSIAGQDEFKAILARMKKAAASRPADKPSDPCGAMAFDANAAWNAQGEIVPSGNGEKYILSTLLAWTSGRGNSVSEALDCLRRAAAADGQTPTGTVYFQVNDDVRSRTRVWGFDAAIKALKGMGVAAEREGPGLPDKKHVAGMVAGVSDFNFAATGSTFDAGAIAEHLTSFGGMLDEGCGQTAMTEWIRCGAAGTSGTVTEPFAIQNKFPLPAIQVHYAHGCSLAEAFYLSVMGPYQLLIMGDPLCKPWRRSRRSAARTCPREGSGANWSSPRRSSRRCRC